MTDFELYEYSENKLKEARKRIAELEYQLTHRNCLDCSNHSSKLRMRNLDLEKENAELKKKLEKATTHRISNCNKANEWHKADVPTTPINKVVLGYIKDYNTKKFCLVKWNGEWWYDARTWNDKVKLIAWKEIVLPKEIE